MSTRYKFKRFKPAEKIIKYTAIEVLQDKMEFYHERGIQLFVALKRELKENGVGRGDLAAAMSKNIIHCHDMAIECAHKLAPYQNPKLQSVEVNKKVTHRFVIQAPKIIKDSQTWLDSVRQIEDQPKLINGVDHGSSGRP